MRWMASQLWCNLREGVRDHLSRSFLVHPLILPISDGQTDVSGGDSQSNSGNGSGSIGNGGEGGGGERQSRFVYLDCSCQDQKNAPALSTRVLLRRGRGECFHFLPYLVLLKVMLVIATAHECDQFAYLSSRPNNCCTLNG